MNELWNSRYSEDGFAYGKKPNDYFKSEIEKLKPGKLLLPAEGQGRNAVFAASLGWQVDAFDFSEVAREKALMLAEEEHVTINYSVMSFEEFDPEPEIYDAAAIIFVHQPIELREKLNAGIISSLKPGGTLIIEVFDKDQLKYNSGGPKDEEQLSSLEEVYNDFSTFDIDNFSKEIITLVEGKYHQGQASVIRFTGKKPSL